MLEYRVRARRLDAHGSEAETKEAKLTLETGEDDRRLELLHSNVRKYGTIYNTVSRATKLEGIMRRSAA